MIIAELNGKLSNKLDDKEDILTSNVFSFFKYSDRQLLKEYLHRLGIIVSIAESKSAEFVFWPSYDDGTEPDLVIICGKYYLLFEAKLYSDFLPKSKSADSQIERELRMGRMVAKNLGKDFVYVALTAEYNELKNKFKKYESKDYIFKWTNWQLIASFLYSKLVEDKVNQDKKFAVDLYSLLVKKKLRCFNGINSIKFQGELEFKDSIYYSIETSKYKGEFSGFLCRLEAFEEIKPYQPSLKKFFFKNLISFETDNSEKVIYYGK